MYIIRMLSKICGYSKGLIIDHRKSMHSYKLFSFCLVVDVFSYPVCTSHYESLLAWW